MRSGETTIIILLLLVAVFACYSAVLEAGFVWDDQFIVLKNSLIRAPIWSLQPFKQDIVNSSFTYTIYYRPVQIISYALDHRVWGLDPFGFHLGNLLLHFINAVLAFFFARRLTGDMAVSTLAALLFAVHPVHMGAVAYISGRTDLLFFLFGFLFMFSAAAAGERKNPFFSVSGTFFLLLALLSKEAAVVFPFLFLLADAVVLRKKRPGGMAHHLPGFVLIGVFAAVHRLLLGGRYPRFGGWSAVSMAIKYLKDMISSVSLNLFPSGLHMRRAAGTDTPGLAAGILIIAIMALLVLSLRGRRKILVFSFGFFALSALPFALAGVMFGLSAEHWLYLASFGILLFVSSSVIGLYEKNWAPVRALMLAVVFIAMTFYSAITMQQTEYWKDDLSLSRRVLSFSPGDRTAMRFKALSAVKKQRSDRPVDIMKELRSDIPVTARDRYLKGRMYLVMGEADKAEKEFRGAMEADPGYDNSYLGMAMSEFMKGNDESGMEYLERTLEVNPSHPEALLLLGKAYSKANRNREALELSKKAREQDPYGYNTLAGLGRAYLKLGGQREAAVLFLRAAELYPDKAEPRYELGRIFYMSSGGPGGDASAWSEAERWLRDAVMADPDFEPAIKLLRKMKERP